MHRLPTRTRWKACVLAAALIGAASIVLPTPSAATEHAMRVDTVVAPAQAAAAALPAVAVIRFSQVDVPRFDMLGLSWVGSPEGAARVRVRKSGQWGPWSGLELHEHDGPDPGSHEDRHGRTFTRPLWDGDADGYEVEAPRDDLRVHLVRRDTARVRLQLGAPRPARAAAGPPINGRGSWGARAPSGPIGVASSLKMAFVHHTAGSNSYAPNDVPRILRADQAYHMDALGWDDLGYNFVVDRFGRMWEGRAGGIERAVIGAHTQGFNTSSTGVAVIGTFTTTAVPNAAVDAVARLVGWKLGIHRADPGGTARMTSGGNDRYPAGTVVTFPAVSGHRDGKATDCPGQRLYDRLAEIRHKARAEASAIASVVSYPVWYLRSTNTTGTADAGIFVYGDQGDLVLTCDWDGDGSSSPVIRRGGAFFLRRNNTTGAADLAFPFGNPGDAPLCGDWNGDGVDTVGVKRGRTWFLNNQNDASAPELVFDYGDPGDWPVAGNWDGDAGRTDTVGIKRGRTWFLNYQNDPSPPERVFDYGDPRDWPLVGDWDGGLTGDSVGVFRGGAWFLNRTNDPSPPEYVFWYGNPSDVPLAGDWDGNGSRTPGVVRH